MRRTPISASDDVPTMVAATAVVPAYQGTMIHGTFAQSPSRTATRLSRNTSAATSPRAICSPRSGEKLRKTPSARAAAVRRGLSMVAM